MCLFLVFETLTLHLTWTVKAWKCHFTSVRELHADVSSSLNRIKCKANWSIHPSIRPPFLVFMFSWAEVSGCWFYPLPIYLCLDSVRHVKELMSACEDIKSLQFSDFLSAVYKNKCISVTAPKPVWFFNAPPAAIILTFQLPLSTLNLHSLFFTCDNGAENVTVPFSRTNDLLVLQRQGRLKGEIMTIIEEQFSQGVVLAKEAWRLRCPKCQYAF